MRILVLAWHFPPHASGGTATQVEGLARALAASGDEVVVVTHRSASDPVDSSTAGVRVLRADCELPWLDEHESTAKMASANHHLVAITTRLGQWRPDVVHAHDWEVGWAAHTLSRLHGTPLVTTFHGTSRSRHGGHVPPGPASTVDNVEWWLALQSTQSIAITKTIQRGIVADFELDPGRVVHVPSGIDPTWWARPADAAPPTPGLVFGWGRVQYEKGFQVLARAIGELRSEISGLHCTIAGRGSYLPELQSQIDLAQAGDLIELSGFLSGTQLRNTLHRSQCVVIPSLYEPFGLVALEALASGIPLVASDTGGLAELVGGTNAAVMVEPGNAQALARGMKTVLEDQEFAAELSNRGMQLIDEAYAWRPIATRTRAVYERALVDT